MYHKTTFLLLALMLCFGFTLSTANAQTESSSTTNFDDVPVLSNTEIYCSNFNTLKSCKNADGVRLNWDQKVISGKDYLKDCKWDNEKELCHARYDEKDYLIHFISRLSFLFLVAIVVIGYIIRLVK